MKTPSHPFMYRILIVSIFSLVLGGCALAPGMYAGGLDTGTTMVAKDPKTGRGIPVSVIPVTLAELEKFSPPVREGMPIENAAGHAYRLGPGDVVSITVWEHPELTIPQGEFRSAEAAGNQVDEWGFLYYPYCGEIHVAEMTRVQLRKELSQCLAKVIRRPQVEVRIIQFRSQRVAVGGAVNQPGIVPVTDVPLRAMDAIQASGGFAPEANARFVNVTRNGEIYKLDLKAYTETGNQAHNPYLQGGDTVHVSHGGEQHINVLGEFLRPQNLPLDDSLRTLADAIGAASGINPNAAEADRILVMRKIGDARTVLWFKAADPLQLAAAQELELQSGDVVYVDQTGLNRWNRVISLMLPSALTSIGNTAAVSARP